jgi:hypothetical protein
MGRDRCDPRPTRLARRSASSPWCRLSVKAPSSLKVRASHAWDLIRYWALGGLDSRSGHGHRTGRKEEVLLWGERVADSVQTG